MSAPSVLEVYDAPMMDYDIPMHSGPSSGDAWYSTEAQMEDDDLDARLLGDEESVEVDMEPHDDIDIEYEMQDADVHEDGVELVDVEVYDLPHADHAVPATEPAHLSAGVPATGAFAPIIAFTETSQNVETTTHVSEPTVVADAGEPSPHHAPSHDGGVILIAPRTDETAAPLDSQNADLGFVVSPADGFPEHDSGAALDSHVPQPEATSQAAQDPAPVSFPDAEASITVSSDLRQPGDRVDALQVESPSHPAASSPAAQADQEEHADGPLTHDSPTRYDAALPLVPVDSGPKELPPAEQTESAPQGVLDPHEISDGVYIDPPPAVSLSLSAGNEPDCYLFNHPPSDEIPLTATEEESKEENLPVLLEHRPTLYYEPLSSVFEAFRAEEYFTHIPSLSTAEMVLEAYDLDLSITEDNFYAREVTLHDLNMLHDGSALPGQLRLRLNFVSPRFIVRYQEVRDHVARLTLGTDGEQGHKGVIAPAVATQVESTHLKTAPLHPGSPPSPHDEQAESDARAEDNGKHKDEPELASDHAHAAEEGLLQDNEAAGDEEQTEAVQGADENAYHNEGDSNGAVPPTVAEVAAIDAPYGGPLDADGVHHDEHAGDDGGTEEEDDHTEYEEYEEYNEEDDERYGEDLPQELGGQDGVGEQVDSPAASGDDEGVSSEAAPTESLKPPALVASGEQDSLTVDLGAEQAYAEDTIDNNNANTDEFDLDAEGEDDDSADTFTENATVLNADIVNTGASTTDSDRVDVAHASSSAAAPASLDADSPHIVVPANVPVFDDEEEEWDDEDDGAGIGAQEDELFDPEDPELASAESSTTLSSSTSKRAFGEVDEDEADAEAGEGSYTSPGPKRPRVE